MRGSSHSFWHYAPFVMTSEAKTLQRGGCTIAYETGGAAGAETVVLLHGFGMSRDSMRALAHDLRGLGAAGRTLVADARGHGETRCGEAEALDYPEMRGDLHALLEREAPGGAHLVGHSMGGQIALVEAIAHPELVRSLALIGAGPCRAITEERERKSWERAAVGFEAASREELCASLASAAPTKSPELAPETLYGDALGPNLARVVRDGFLHVEGNDDACRAVRAPAVLLVGRDDRTWLEPTRSLASLLPGAELHVVPDAGHLVHLEHASTCAARVAEGIRGAIREGASRTERS